jgi:signal transduction histidine kinase
MKTGIAALFCCWFLLQMPVAFSQVQSKSGINMPRTRITKPFLKPLMNREALDDAFGSLPKTNTPAQKADLYFTLSWHLANMLKIDSALLYSNKIKEESEAGNYEAGMGKYYLAEEHAKFFRGNDKTAIENLTKAIHLFQRNNLSYYEGLCYRQIAKVEERLGHLAECRNSYHRSASLLTAAGDQWELEKTYYEMGINFQQTFETDSAAAYLLLALQLAEYMNESMKIFLAAKGLGGLYMITGDYDNAAVYFRQCLDNRSEKTSKVLARSAVASYANCLIHRKEFKKADGYITEFEKMNGELKDEWGGRMLAYLRGLYKYSQGNYAEARTQLQAAYQTIKVGKTWQQEVRDISWYLAKADYETGHYDEAIALSFDVINNSYMLRSGVEAMSANLLISQSYEKMKMNDSAYYYFKAYERQKDSLQAFRKEKTIIELTKFYESEKKEQQILLLQKENKLTDYQLQLRNEQIEKQNLLTRRNVQQMELLSQQNEINRLAASEKTLALESQQKEFNKKQNELKLLSKENELQAAIVAKERLRKNFAYLGIGAILLFSAYVFYRFRQHRNLGRQLSHSLVELKETQENLIRVEKEKEADNIRVRISRDIHDEVGATLSGVAFFSEMAKLKMEQNQQKDAQVYLKHITANSKEMVEKISDIVWAINPQNDSFDRIIAKLQAYAVNLCAGKDMRLHWNVPNQFRNYYPGMQERRNLYMLIKEGMNNAIKYSAAKNIYFSLLQQQDQLVIEIKDDGDGFDMQTVKKGNGLLNMQSRAAELNGTLQVESTIGKGTLIRLQFEFHPAGGQLRVGSH